MTKQQRLASILRSVPSADPARVGGVVALLLTGSIFGFFYAYTSSAMYGLDSVDPRTAIEAMQGINNTIRNPVFFPAFFLTPVALVATAGLSWRSRRRSAAGWFGGAALVYFFGGAVLTMAINVPMNNELGALAVPESIEAARQTWTDYSPDWQRWNLIRTVFSGLALAGAGIGLIQLGSPDQRSSDQSRPHVRTD